ncbi:transcriptional regulator [Vandammella animalimorsus]|uniref:Transcriptional regulator n=1 Tax=Vandammella animalimorsus TaxID=2029117 RepID=A0A3M6R5N4_9BURK|nr:metalloregulator ArsR/SmtB family transcription factor [Vandammella animalimorsus]RMX10495.1 transcriptional regulator [Vandammella animalimorsus]
MTEAVALTPELMRSGAGSAVTTLKLLANEDRLLLLCHLAQGECCVSDLAAALGIRQPSLSQQLAILRSENVVSTRRDGKRIFYSIAQPEILQLLQLLHTLYCPNLQGSNASGASPAQSCAAA